MGRRKGGYRRGSRQLLRKSHRASGKVSLSRFLAVFEKGQRVALKAEPAYHKGLYHLRFHGRDGFVAGRRGVCYEVLITDGGKEKKLIVHPVHLKLL